MRLKNQTPKELIKEYINKFHSVYNAMEQVKKTNPYADTTKFSKTIHRLSSLINLHTKLARGVYDDN